MPFFGFLVQALLLYFIVRHATKDPTLDWRWCAGWLLVALVVKLALYFGLAYGLKVEEGFAYVLGVVGFFGTLTFFIWWQGYKPSQTATILGMFLLMGIGLELLFFLARRA